MMDFPMLPPGTTSPIAAVPMSEEILRTVLEITKAGVRLYDSHSEVSASKLNDLIPIIVEQELRKQKITNKAKPGEKEVGKNLGQEPLTYQLFGKADETAETSPPLKVHLPNQTHIYIFNGITEFYSLESLPRKSLSEETNSKSTMSGFLVGGIAFTHPTAVPQVLSLLRSQMVFNTVISSCVRLPPTDETKANASTTHIFEIQALNFYRLSISFEVEEDNDMGELQVDEDLMSQVEAEMEDTMVGDAAGLVAAEINLKVMSEAKCELKGNVDKSLLPSDEFATKVLNKTLSIPVTMRAILRKCLQLQHERKQKKIKKISDILSARAKAAAEAASLALRQKQQQILQQQQEKKTCANCHYACIYI